MTRRVEVLKLPRGFSVTGFAETEAEAACLQFALLGVPSADAFAPNPGRVAPKLGIPFDPPEEWPSDKTAKTVGEVGDFVTGPPNCDGLNCAEVLTERTAGDD